MASKIRSTLAHLARPKVDFGEAWARLGATTSALLTRSRLVTNEEWQRSMHEAYQLALVGGADLYHALEALLVREAEAVRDVLVAGEAEDVLRRYLSLWARFRDGAAAVSQCFDYLNRNWIHSHTMDAGVMAGASRPVLHVLVLAHVTFRDVVFRGVSSRLIAAVLGEMDAARRGGQWQVDLVREYLASLRMLSTRPLQPRALYEEGFERPYLQAVQLACSTCLGALRADSGAAEYVEGALAVVGREESFCTTAFDPSTMAPLRDLLTQAAVRAYGEQLLEEARELLAAERAGDLASMFRLLSRDADATMRFRELVHAHVEHAGRRRLEDAERVRRGGGRDGSGEGAAAAARRQDRDRHAVEDHLYVLLDLVRHFRALVATFTSGDAAFMSTVDKACRTFVNRDRQTAVVLAKFCNLLLSKQTTSAAADSALTHARQARARLEADLGADAQGTSAAGVGELDEDAPLEGALDQAMVVFRYVEDQDVFQRHYQRLFARRLILEMSVSIDSELAMLSRMRIESGFEFTSRLQRMYNDMAVQTVDNPLQERLRQHLPAFAVRVLTQGIWPISSSPVAPNFAPPEPLLVGMRAFQRIFQQQHSHRVLTWLHHLSSGTVRARYAARTYDVVVSAHQLAVLLLFNDADRLPTATVASVTGLDGADLRRTVDSLLKVQLLTADGDDLVYHADFKSKRLRIKIATALFKTDGEREQAETNARVDDDRKILIQAAIVRIMKARKTLEHSSLVAETLAQVSRTFKPRVVDVKKAIESLLERDYLERQDDNAYSYVA